MVRARKKPIEIEAVQWTGSNLGEVQDFVGLMSNMDGDVSTWRFLGPRARDDAGQMIFPVGARFAHLWVEANQAWIPVPVGQWVLEDRAGFYPCKPDIFEATYDIIEVPNDQEVTA